LFENHLSENGEFLGMCINSGASFNGKILIDLSRSLTTICLIFSWKKKRKKVSRKANFYTKERYQYYYFCVWLNYNFGKKRILAPKNQKKVCLKKSPSSI